MGSEHKKLSDLITGVHEKLKRSLFFTQDAQKVWQNHVEEGDLRKSYSLAMLKLATEVWNGKECRIEWSYNTCKDYFYNGGLKQSLSREIKLQEKSSDKIKEARYLSCEVNNYESINRKLNLLDVGSCYNPFSKFTEFSCMAIDLTPATEDVLQCDFLSIDIHKKSSDKVPVDSKLTFYEESFDIVVFSMVLEYLPATEQRAVFCFKAWQLLQLNGLFVIITPDSKSLHHNAPMIKSWKLALEKIGFLRVKYDKLRHLHCMAFRKCSTCSKVNMTDCASLAPLLYTPQDFKTYEEDVAVIDRNDEENHCIYEQFLELPLLNECLFNN